ncbi:MAG: BsaWI family type II restriction enzyme [Candidatus Asgardarchaeia archaeon]
MSKVNKNFGGRNEIKKELRNIITSLESREYLVPTIKAFDDRIKHFSSGGLSEKDALITILDYITEIMRGSEADVEKIIQRRIEEGKIKDTSQTRVAVAGSNFQGIIAYALIKNILIENIPPLLVVLRPKQSRYRKTLEKYTKILVGGEVQKPDVDIMVYDPLREDKPVIVYSCKTSLRERAGQTYRWKLLYDMATTKCKFIEESEECPINKYDIKFEGEREVLVGFITADFYDEIKSPQARGMLSFFDFAYVTKPDVNFEKVKRLSEIVNDLREVYRSGGSFA